MGEVVFVAGEGRVGALGCDFACWIGGVFLVIFCVGS